MRTLHKLTHRPLALCAFFVGLGVLGWHLPELGSAVLAYSSNVMKAARATTGTPTRTTAVPAAATSAVAAAPATTAQASISAQLDAARGALEAAIAALRTSNTKANRLVVEAARDEVNRLAALRVAEIKGLLNGAGQNQASATAAKDTAAGPTVPNYAALVQELAALGGLNPSLNTPTPNTTPEVEPNNTAATAQTLNLSAQNVTIITAAITAGDQDWFKFTTSAANSKAYIYVDTGNNVSGQRDSQLTLFQADGTTEIEFDDDGASGNGCDGTQETALASAIAGANLATAGTYVFKVNHFSATGVIPAYKIFVVVTPSSVPAVTDTEPNDTTATAQSLLTAAQTVAVANGNVASSEADFYKLDLKAGNILYLSLDGDPERDDNNTDTSVRLVAPDGTTTLFTADNTFGGASPGDPLSEAFCFAITTDGTYFVRVFGFTSTPASTSYRLLAAAANSGSAGPTCPPTPITSNLGTAGGNFPKTSGTMTQRLNRDGVTSACGVARTQAAPIAGSFTFDKYTFTNSGGATACITIALTVVEQAASNYMVGAFSTFVPTNLTSGWLGDPGFSSGIPPTIRSFSVNVAAGASFDVVVFNTNATGDGNAYQLNVFGLPGCVTPPCGITCPANITTNVAAGSCAATVTYAAPATTGFCNAVTCTPPSGSSFQKGVTTVTCTSAGNSNGTQTCSFTVTVVDNIPPAFTAKPDISVGTTGASQVVTYTNPMATDNCAGLGAVTCNPPSGFAFPLGTTTVTCTVADAVGLTATTTFRVHVNQMAGGSLTDPLACTGPGNKVNGSFTVTNNSAVTQAVAATVTLGPTTPVQGLLALSCTASVGTCTIAANGASLSYTASLNAGVAVTVSYVLQVNDGVAPSTVLTSSVSATFNGGAPVLAGASITVSCPLAGPGTPFINNPERTVMNDQRAGSILFYPIYTSDAAGGGTQNARISLTNTSDKLGTFVHLFFVDGATCSVSDAYVCLTPNQTSSFLTSDLDPGTRGYIVAIATDANGCPRHFNYLIGDEFVKFSTGHRANLGAEAVAAIAGSTFWVSCDGSAPTSVVRFDGVSYGLVPYTLAADSIGSTADGNNTLLVINRIGGDLQTGPSRLVPIFGTLYDDSEISYSFNLPTNNLCQYAASLTDSVPRTTPRLSTIIPTGRTGWFKLAGTSEIGIFGATINFNPNVASSAGAYNGGHNLHKVTFTSTMTYTVPVFPPTC